MGTEQENYNDYKRKLRIKDNCGLGRKLEEIDAFKDSYFRDNYYDAFVLTQRILSRNSEMKKNREWEERKYVQERLYNIITFCGERGAGKTSVMDSVVGALQSDADKYGKFIRDYEKSREAGEDASDLSRMLNKYEFVCLEGIDASLLERKEDILDVILAKMLQKLKYHRKNMERNHPWETEMRASHSQADIYREFEKICQSKRRLFWRMDNPYEPGESSTEELSNLAGSLDIREKLQNLIPVYLQVLSPGREKSKQYLVINIDDLDMHRNAYQMLEQLHRYLMIPQVIIYIAVSEREISAVCRKHFEKTYDSPAELAMSYLEKVLPYSRRVYLPSTVNGDFFNIATGDDRRDNYSNKEFILREIAWKTQVYYDGRGLETHFYEMGNLRTLFNFYYLLDGMAKPEKKKLLLGKTGISGKDREALDSNFDKLKNDVIGRMAIEKLKDKEQLKIFKAYYKEDFSCNGEYLVEQIIRIVDESKVELESELEFEKKYLAGGSSYGKILYALYMLSKAKKEFEPLIQCVLAIESIELTQNYVYTFYTEEKTSRRKWKEYISDSVWENWGNQILPKVKKDNRENDTPKSLAYVKSLKMQANVDLEEVEKDIAPESKAFDVCKYLIDECSLVESFELFMSFVTKKNRIAAEEYDILMKCPLDSNDSKKTICFTLSRWECTFDILGMIVNIIDYEGREGVDYEGYFKRVHDNLFHMLEKYCENNGGPLKSEQSEELETMINKKSMKEAYIKWDEEYGRIALPLYSMDIMYNILRRVKRKMEKEQPEIVESKDFLFVVTKFYVLLKEELEDEDEFYGSILGSAKNSHTKFHERFLYYPFIYPFIKTKDDKTENGDSGKEPEKGSENNLESTERLTAKKELTQALLDTLPEMFKQLFNGFVKKLVNT